MPDPDPPVITLLSDFGLIDPYVGIMKGVILARSPEARLIDLTHQIEPQNVRAGGYLLASAWRYFPEGSVHVAVVDPGVGSSRGVIAALFEDHYFIAPDNGLLSLVFKEAQPERVVRVENDTYFLHPVSRTFHGRDIFAPVSAYLANGMPLTEFGPPTEQWHRLPRSSPHRQPDGSLGGEVIYSDHFGNLITNIHEQDLPPGPQIEIAHRTIPGLTLTYASEPQGALLALIGSTRHLEISINQGNAKEHLGIGAGAPVRVTSTASRH